MTKRQDRQKRAPEYASGGNCGFRLEIRINDPMRIDVADLEILPCNGISRE